MSTEQVSVENPTQERPTHEEPTKIHDQHGAQDSNVDTIVENGEATTTTTDATTVVESKSDPAPSTTTTTQFAQVVESTPVVIENQIATSSTSAPSKSGSRGAEVIHLGNGIYRRAANVEKLEERRFPECGTLHDLFMRGATKFPNRNCLGRRETGGSYTWLTYEQALTKIKNFASGLRKLGISPHEKFGIYSENRVEWQIASEACNAQSITTVALYDTLGSDSSVYIVNHSEVKGIVCSPKTIKNLLSIYPQLDDVRFIVQMGAISEETRASATEVKAQLFSFDEVEKLGAENPYEFTVPSPDDVAIIMYTSGTTGMPKGAPLKHRMIVATVSGVLDSIVPITEEDVFASYLPLAHILQRNVEAACFAHGSSIGYWQGDVNLLMEDLEELKPTLMAAVPRVLERIKLGIETKINEKKISKMLFKKGFAQKQKNMAKGKRGSNFWDGILFKKIQKKLGGRLRAIISGGAYLRPETQQFIRVVFGCPVIQGYGLTETCAGGTIASWDDPTNGHIGAPVSCAEIKLAPVPEMGYAQSNDPPSGEICLRGHCVFEGYFKDEAKTREVFDSDGFFHTGDIAQLVDNRFIIVDRVKNLIKLPQGEYVALEKVETAMMNSPLVEQIMVYADISQPHLVAVAVPREPAIAEFAKSRCITGDFATLCKNMDVRLHVLESIQSAGKAAKLLPYEIPQHVFLTPEMFTVENDLLTPSMKMKRPSIRDKYIDGINDMYAHPAPAPAPAADKKQ